MAEGRSPYEISKFLQPLAEGKDDKYTNAFGQTMTKQEFNAMRIARTETAHIQIKSACDKYKEMGFTTGT